jgi:plastocyanin
MRPTSSRRTVVALIATASVSAAALSAVAVAATTTRAVDNSRAEFAFSKKTLKAKQGTVLLRFTNRGGTSHNIALKGRTIKTKKGRVVAPGRVSTVRAVLRPGRYTFFCSVPGHEQSGMKGTLTVTR